MVGIVVDQVVGRYQSTVRSMGRLDIGRDGIAGVVYLSDGNPAYLIDIASLVAHAWSDFPEGD